MTSTRHYVGLDLAWGERSPTGVAVLDEHTRLRLVTSARTDEEILAAIGRYAAGPCVVAIDAPLVVTNPTGNRPAEAALNRDFARFDAGAHPSNTSRPWFVPEPRGARLARAMGLDLAPHSGAPRRALEVYPHPATVALFRLGRTLKYKAKPGRDLPSLRTALLTLTAHLATLAAATPALNLSTPAWDQLVRAIHDAGRKSELRRAEDQVDAVVCAYVAAYADRRPSDTTTYGDLATGYLVTPTLPQGHAPTPRTTR
jgi:predicted RNase H-like nuclease